MLHSNLDHLPRRRRAHLRAYFAYAINMHPDEMAHRCPKATLQGTATLNGHRFIINQRGVATLVPTARSLVYGVLWNLTASDEAALDPVEGVNEGFYKKPVIMARHEGREYPAFIYLASNSTPGWPRPGYLETVCNAARSFRFPATYVGKLVALSGRA